MLQIKVTKEEKQRLLDRFDVNRAEEVFDNNRKKYVHIIEIACVLCQKYTCPHCPVTQAYKEANRKFSMRACGDWLFQAWLESEPEVPTLYSRFFGFTKTFIEFRGRKGKFVVETLRSQLDKYLVVEKIKEK